MGGDPPGLPPGPAQRDSTTGAWARRGTAGLRDCGQGAGGGASSTGRGRDPRRGLARCGVPWSWSQEARVSGAHPPAAHPSSQLCLHLGIRPSAPAPALGQVPAPGLAPGQGMW